jgi:hypothetical protein
MVDSKPVARKTKRKGNPNWKKGGPSPNPAGAPRRGQSWKEIIQEIGEMTPDEARAVSEKIFEQVKLGNEITLKQAVVMRVYAALLFEPQPGLLNAFMERVEGKVAQPITDMTDDEIRQFIASEIGIDLPGGDGGETARNITDESHADSARNIT